MITDLFGNPDEEAMYQAALAVPLNQKIDMAIKLIQTFEGQALERSADGYYVAFSGGKDSIVMERLFHMSGVKYQAWYNNVTIDPPELVQFIKRQYPEVKWNNPAMHLTSKMVDKSCGPPTRLARWCCEIYKEQGGRGLFKAIGVRADESARRKGTWHTVTLHKSDLSPILSPILYWTESNVWQFIRDNRMPYCSLYDEGFKRLGCVGCPIGGPAAQAREFARWPKYEAMWKRGFKRYWEKYKGTPTKKGGERWIEKFPDVEAFWQWWISGKAYEGEGADCQLYWW